MRAPHDFARYVAAALTLATLACAAVTLLLPLSPIAEPLGLTPMPWSFLLLLAAILCAYVVSAELVKRRFYETAA